MTDDTQLLYPKKSTLIITVAAISAHRIVYETEINGETEIRYYQQPEDCKFPISSLRRNHTYVIVCYKRGQRWYWQLAFPLEIASVIGPTDDFEE